MGGIVIAGGVGAVLAGLLAFTAPALLSSSNSQSVSAPLVVYGSR
jgi:hypothetical protein